MTDKRTDSRGRILRNGEYQKADGRYAFRYVDAKGKARFVYSWTLTKKIKRQAERRNPRLFASLRSKLSMTSSLAFPLRR